MDYIPAHVQRQQTPPPSPDVWDMFMVSTPPPDDLSARYPLPTTPSAERYAKVNFWGLRGSPTALGDSQFFHRGGQVDIEDLFGPPFSDNSMKGLEAEHSGVSDGGDFDTEMMLPKASNAAFGRDRGNDPVEMTFEPFGGGSKTKVKVERLPSDVVIVDPEAPRTFQVINESQYQALDEQSRRRYQVAYENIEGVFYAASDFAEPVERVVRARREEWRELKDHRRSRRR